MLRYVNSIASTFGAVGIMCLLGVLPLPGKAHAQADGCEPGEVLIGGQCRPLGKKPSAKPVTKKESASGGDCAAGEVKIGGQCRALARKKTAEPAVEDEPEEDSAEACGANEVKIGGQCRALSKRKAAEPARDNAAAGGSNVECGQGEVRIGRSCRRQDPDSGTERNRQPTHAGDNMLAWHYVRSNQADANGATVATLFYGVPETDNVQMSASCSSLDGASQPRVIVSSDVPRAAPGLPVPIRFAAPSFDRMFLGLAIQGDEAEGGELDIETDDPLWSALTRLDFIGYSVDDEPPLDLPLAGLRDPLRRFLTDCSMFASRDPGARIVASATELFSFDGGHFAGSGGSCEALGATLSTSNGVPIVVTFTNRSGEHRVLDWVDFNGTPVEYAQLADGQSFTVNTHTAHPWMVTDGPGNCIERFMPTQNEIIIARKSPGFGDE
jgi:hypothetical protein